MADNMRDKDAPRIRVPRFGAGSILMYRPRFMARTLYQEGVRRGVIPANVMRHWRLGHFQIFHSLIEVTFLPREC